ncbi:MAG: lipid II flippase MurJ [Spirosomataceae bacterium]
MSLDYRNIGVLFSLNTLNVFLNVVISTLMVYLFGTSSQVEAFFAATVLGNTVSRFVNTGQLVEIIIARYHRIKQEVSPQAAMSVVSTLSNYMVGIAFLLVLVFVASGTWIVNLLVPGFDASTKKEVWQIFCITGFLMPFQIATNLFQGMLNAENIYGKVEFTATLSQMVNLLILLIWGRNGDAFVLVIALVISVLAQFGTIVYYLQQIGYRHAWLFRNPHFPLRELAKTLSATSTYMVSVQIYTFIFNAALSLLPAGSFAIYRYAELIYGKVANIFLIPISTVFFNEINRFITQNNGQLVKSYVSKNLNFSYFIGFLLLLPFWAGGKYLIWTLWGGIKFNAQDVVSVYELLCVFFLAMIWSGPYMIFRKLAVSVTRPELQYYYWSIIHVVSATIAYFLIRTLGFNGILIQLFVHSFLMAAVPMMTVWLWKRTYFGLYEWKEVLKITLALSIGVVIIWGIRSFCQEITTYSKTYSFLVGSSLSFVSLLIFGGISLLLNVEEIRLIQTKVLSRMGIEPQNEIINL